MDKAGQTSSNPIFSEAARRRVWNKYIDPENAVVGVYKDPAAAKVSKNEPEVQDEDLGVNFFG